MYLPAWYQHDIRAGIRDSLVLAAVEQRRSEEVSFHPAHIERTETRSIIKNEMSKGLRRKAHARRALLAIAVRLPHWATTLFIRLNDTEAVVAPDRSFDILAELERGARGIACRRKVKDAGVRAVRVVRAAEDNGLRAAELAGLVAVPGRQR